MKTLCPIIVLICCIGFAQGQQGSLSRLDIECHRIFGAPYWRGKLPADDFATHAGSELKSSRSLRVLQFRALSRLSSKSTAKVLANMEDDLADHPEDSQRLFMLAYAFTELARRQHEGGGGSFWPQRYPWRRMLSWMLSNSAGDVLSPADRSSFEWLRVRFLVQGALDSHPKLIPLGQKLLESRPDDLELSLTLCYQLALSNTLLGTGAAIKMSRECQTRWPNTSLAFLNLDNLAYYLRWTNLGRHRQDLELAIQTVEKILKKLPVKGLDTEQAEGQLWSLKESQKLGRPVTAAEIFAHARASKGGD